MRRPLRLGFHRHRVLKPGIVPGNQLFSAIGDPIQQRLQPIAVRAGEIVQNITGNVLIGK